MTNLKKKKVVTTDGLLPQITPPLHERVYGVDYTYSRSQCSGHCDDYCRCTQILGARVTKIESWDSLINSFCPEIGSRDSLDYYLVERFLHRFLNLEDFEVETGGGYYGDEVYGVNFEPKYKDMRPIETFNGLQTQTERLRFILRQEYGYLLPDIEMVSEWEIQEVDIEDVNAFEGHMKHVDLKTVKSYSESLPHIICICIPDDVKFRLIDGRHRFTAALQEENETVNILVPKKGSKVRSVSDNQIRAQALAKLSEREKRVLGLS